MLHYILQFNAALAHPPIQVVPSEDLDSYAICLRDAYSHYGSGKRKVPVLIGLDMTIPRGAIYGLLGPSGCGKTTLLSCIVGKQVRKRNNYI